MGAKPRPQAQLAAQAEPGANPEDKQGSEQQAEAAKVKVDAAKPAAVLKVGDVHQVQTQDAVHHSVQEAAAAAGNHPEGAVKAEVGAIEGAATETQQMEEATEAEQDPEFPPED